MLNPTHPLTRLGCWHIIMLWMTGRMRHAVSVHVYCMQLGSWIFNCNIIPQCRFLPSMIWHCWLGWPVITECWYSGGFALPLPSFLAALKSRIVCQSDTGLPGCPRILVIKWGYAYARMQMAHKKMSTVEMITVQGIKKWFQCHFIVVTLFIKSNSLEESFVAMFELLLLQTSAQIVIIWHLINWKMLSEQNWLWSRQTNI